MQSTTVDSQIVYSVYQEDLFQRAGAIRGVFGHTIFYHLNPLDTHVICAQFSNTQRFEGYRALDKFTGQKVNRALAGK